MSAPSPATTPAEIAAQIAAEMPPPSAPAPVTPTAAPPPQAAAAPAATAPATDRLGRTFDPARFLANADGAPRLDSLGRFIPRGLGRKTKPGAAPAAPQAAPSFIPNAGPAPQAAPSFIPNAGPAPQAAPDHAAPADQAAAPEPAAVPTSHADRFRILGDVYTRSGIAVAMAVFGKEWAPDDDQEFLGLRDLAADYLRATNQTDLSPGWALALGLTAYAGKRFPRPQTQTRIAGLVGAVKAWWRGRSIARRVAAYPRPEAAQ